jgi:methionine-gamma-lyase
MKTNLHHKSTRAIHAGGLEHPVFGEISVPIFQSSTFAFPNADEGAARFAGESPGYIYTRLSNPTINALEECVAQLENGFAGMATSSGMAAVNTTFLTFLGSGAHIVSSECVYGPTRTVLEKEYSRFGVQAAFVDTSNLDNLKNAMQPNTRLVFIETPANPTITITDINEAAKIAYQHNALLVVDNTFAGPYLQRPLDFGADIVVHSMTKSLNGHGDVVAGMIVTKTKELYAKIKPVLNSFGGTMDPHQAWLVLRGIRTLPMRVERSQENAQKLAEYLLKHPKVLWVTYPGLPGHPQHCIAEKQMDGYGSMISFGIKGGIEAGKILMDSLRLFTLAVSLGGVESLIEHPASMTHAGMSKADREKAGICDELVRVSVGCEDFGDLRDDMEQALNNVYRKLKQ